MRVHDCSVVGWLSLVEAGEKERKRMSEKNSATIRVTRYNHPSVQQQTGYEGVIEPEIDGGHGWIIYFRSDGSGTLWAERDADGGVVGKGVELLACAVSSDSMIGYHLDSDNFTTGLRCELHHVAQTMRRISMDGILGIGVDPNPSNRPREIVVVVVDTLREAYCGSSMGGSFREHVSTKQWTHDCFATRLRALSEQLFSEIFVGLYTNKAGNRFPAFAGLDNMRRTIASIRAAVYLDVERVTDGFDIVVHCGWSVTPPDYVEEAIEATGLA